MAKYTLEYRFIGTPRLLSLSGDNQQEIVKKLRTIKENLQKAYPNHAEKFEVEWMAWKK